MVAADEFVAEGVIPMRSSSGKEIAGKGATVFAAVVTLPSGTDLSSVQPHTTHLWLRKTRAASREATESLRSTLLQRG